MSNVPPLGGSIGTGGTNPFDPTGNDTAPGPLASSLGNALTQGGAIGNALSFFNTLGRPDFWVRAGIVVSGVGLLIVGIIILVSSSKVVGEALTAAGKSAKLTPVGAATSVVTEAIA